MRARDWVSAVAGLAAVAVAIFAIGSAFRWAQAGVAAVTLVAVVPLVLSRRSLGTRSPLVVALGIGAGLTLLQLLPLPGPVLASLQPEGASLRDDGAKLLDLSPWRAITLDAPGTLQSLTFFVILLGIALIALRIAVSENGRYRLLAGIAMLCGLAAVVTGIHELFGATKLYGLYQPAAHPSILGPLLNENHLGSLMAVGATLSIGLTMYRRQHARLRVLWLLVGVVCSVAAVASQSRGAFLALIGGAVIAGAVLLGQRFFGADTARKAPRTFATRSLPIAVVVLSAVLLIVYASAGGVSDQLNRTTLQEIQQPSSKFAIWRSTVDLVRESPWFGVGRGAFEPAFTRSHPASAVLSFSYVENEYLQVAVDWGVPGSILFGLAVTWIFVAGVRRWRDGPLVAAALGALTVVGLQSIVDFGVELLGLAVPITVIAATLAYVPLREISGRARLAARVGVIALLLGLATSVAVLLSSSTMTVAEDHQALDPRQASLQVSDVRASIERHPLDYYGYALVAKVMIRDGDPRAVRFLNHALRLHPTHPGLHHLAARMLYRVGRMEQAAIEYSLALQATPSVGPLIEEVAARLDVKLAASTIPVESERGDVFRKVLSDLGRRDIALQWLIRVLEAHPGNVYACETMYQVSLQSQDLEAAEAASRRCADAAPSFEARIGLARLLLAKNRPEAVEPLLLDVEKWPGRIDHKVTAWLLVCDARIAQAHWEDAKRCLRRLDATGYVPLDGRDQITTRLATITKTSIERDTPHSSTPTTPPQR